MRCCLIIVQRALRMRSTRCALFTADRGLVTCTYGFLDIRDMRVPVRGQCAPAGRNAHAVVLT